MGPQDIAAVIDVMQENIERPHPLDRSFLETSPFRSAKYSGNDIKGDQLFGTAFPTINDESDAKPSKQHTRFVPFAAQFLDRQVFQPQIDVPHHRPGHIAEPIPFVESDR